MLTEMGQRARNASRKMALAPTAVKNATLRSLADLLSGSRNVALGANSQDVTRARQEGMSEALVDRLLLNEKRITALVDDLRRLADLPDPVGQHFDERVLPNGLRLRKQRVPLGVLGVIYEARPNVTLDVAALAIKTGNAAILRGGSETIRTNRALVELTRLALDAGGLPQDAVQFIEDPDGERVLELLKLHEYVDIIIPRGGAQLHKFCRENSQIPVITGGLGICHLFVDESASLQRCLPVIHNAKTQRPSVCNALDTVLVHRKVAAVFLPSLVEYLGKEGVTFRADPSALPFLDSGRGLPASVQTAGPADFDTEWLSLVLGLKVVDDLDAAIAHIAAHSTAHSDGILTESAANAARFMNEVDSAAVYVNASTRFTDGGQFGLGAEVAVSTQRLHARGPMGLTELTTYKWVAEGDYHVREQATGAAAMLDNNPERVLPESPDRWPLRLLIPALIWGQVILVGGTILEPTPENLTLAFSIEAAGLYTLLLYLTRNLWLPLLARRPLLAAAALGIFNAAVIEAEFWAFERFFRASGVAASPNLLLDWLLTMPWYVGMVILFVRGQNRSRFGAVTILALGGLYETAADGIIGGQLIPAVIGQPVALGEAWAFIILVTFWQFILVYSSMLLPPAWVIAKNPLPDGPRKPWRSALLPLMWAIPYAIYLFAALVLMSLVSGR